MREPSRRAALRRRLQGAGLRALASRRRKGGFRCEPGNIMKMPRKCRWIDGHKGTLNSRRPAGCVTVFTGRRCYHFALRTKGSMLLRIGATHHSQAATR